MAKIKGWIARYDSEGRNGLHFLKGCFDKNDGITVPLTDNSFSWEHKNVLGEAKLFLKEEGLYCEAEIDLNGIAYRPRSFGFLGNCTEYEDYEENKKTVKNVIVRVTSLLSINDTKTSYVESIEEDGKTIPDDYFKNDASQDYDDKGWTKTTEKLPNDRDWYLGIFKENDTGWINPIPFICNYVGHVTKVTTNEGWLIRGSTEDENGMCSYYKNLKCLAWKPIPDIPSWAELQ